MHCQADIVGPFLHAEQNGGELRYCYNLRGKIARL
jgi:hypothetical protein